MDHTPGQRQFRDMSKLKTYVRIKNDFTEDEFAEPVEKLSNLQARLGVRMKPPQCPRRGALVRRWRAMMTPRPSRSLFLQVTALPLQNSRRPWKRQKPAGLLTSPSSWGAKSGPWRVAFRQCRCARPRRARLVGHPLVRLGARCASDVGSATWRDVGRPAPRHCNGHCQSRAACRAH